MSEETSGMGVFIDGVRTSTQKCEKGSYWGGKNVTFSLRQPTEEKLFSENENNAHCWLQ